MPSQIWALTMYVVGGPPLPTFPCIQLSIVPKLMAIAMMVTFIWKTIIYRAQTASFHFFSRRIFFENQWLCQCQWCAYCVHMKSRMFFFSPRWGNPTLNLAFQKFNIWAVSQYIPLQHEHLGYLQWFSCYKHWRGHNEEPLFEPCIVIVGPLCNKQNPCHYHEQCKLTRNRWASEVQHLQAVPLTTKHTHQ